MTETGIKQDTDNQERDNRVDRDNRDKSSWMNNPDTIYSLSDVSDVDGQPGQETSFVLTDHGDVVASKTTARANAHSKEQNRHRSELSSQPVKSAQTSALQSALIERIRSDIEEEVKTLRASDLPLGVKLVLIGRAFGRDPEQWLAGDKVSNLFIEAVLYSAGIDLPWGFDAVPDYAELKYILGQDRRFSRVFRTDKLRPQESVRAFLSCDFQDGDLAIWASNGRRLSCFLEKAESDLSDKSVYNVLAGGCPDTTTGFLYTTFEYYSQQYVQVQADKNAMAEPVPDVVYRALKIN